MLTLATLHAEISGNIATVGYALGGLSIVAIAAVLFFGTRLVRARKSKS